MIQGYLRYLIHIVDRPHAITWKEFNEAFSIWVKTHDLNDMDKWMRRQSELVCADIQQAAHELFDSAVGHRRRKLDDAASGVGADDYETHIQLCAEGLNLIEALIQDGLPSVGNEFYQTAANFGMVWGMVQPWLRFTKNSSDRNARLRERDVLLVLAKSATTDPGSFLAVKPWDTHHSAIYEQERLINDFAKELAQQIEPLVTDRLLVRLSEKGATTGLWQRSESLPEKWVLFNRESPLWRNHRRDQLLALLNRANGDLSVHGNALDLIQIVSEGLTEGIGIPYGTDKIRKLVEDKEISGALWKAATARPVQYPSLSRIKTIREQFRKTIREPRAFACPQLVRAVGVSQKHRF